ncbi:Wzz/FepE/Etk N-terminal domain-containing protein [Cytophagaceae bacterium ABcell3]|nr:Wzz/FepE/Etk N-terminal domain-containing protein [Cytophagaceae bacterium ABcell3]
MKEAETKDTVFEGKEVLTNLPEDDNDSNLLETFKILWDGRSLILKSCLIGAVLGILYGFVSQEEYETRVKLLPEINSGKGNGMLNKLGGLAALGGLNLEGMGGSDAVRPDLYPDIVNSMAFGAFLMKENVYLVDSDTSVQVYDYLIAKSGRSPFSYVKKYTLGLPGLLFHKEDNDSLNSVVKQEFITLKFSKEESAIVENIQKRVSAEIDKKSGIITITAKMPDPYVAAFVADKSVRYLTSYVADYRLEKAKLNLDFIQERHKEAEAKYRKSQKALAKFRDQNRNIISASVRTDEEFLQSEFNLAYNIYNSLAQQLEQAQITVQEETPVFKVLEPVSVPVYKSEPKRGLILIGFLFLGLVFACFVVYIKGQYAKTNSFHFLFK